ncbi:MAG: Transposase [Marmoricola sp.]|nr:Transposase [Marmoricola sp.]
MRAVAADLGRAPSTISREVARLTTSGGEYVAKRAHAIAFEDAKRPQVRKIDADPVLRARVIADLVGRKKWSPQQIAGRLAREFPEQLEMHLHHETIYRWIYMQPRGELKREVTTALRRGRAMRVPAKHLQPVTGQGLIPDMVSIHQRPPVDEPDGTRIPGHWEGDLIIGAKNASAIGTLVERATGYVMLLPLPEGRSAENVAAAVTARLAGLPGRLRKSLTWDQGKEMSQHKKVSIDAGIEVYFADPHTPWHRPSNENVNGLLRQYFPKATDLNLHSIQDIAEVEAALNDRPRKRLDYAKPDELIALLLLAP